MARMNMTAVLGKYRERAADHAAMVERNAAKYPPPSPEAYARAALRDHDRTYMMSDDPRILDRGRRESATICDLLDRLDDDAVARLADAFFVQPMDADIAMRFVEALKQRGNDDAA